MKISLQLYSLRDAAKEDFLGTIKKVADMGYEGIEFAGYFDTPADDINNTLNDLGIECSGAHVQLAAFDDDKFDETVSFHKAIGCKYPIIPWLPEEMRNTPDQVLKTCERMNAINAKLKDHGMRTGFHVHEDDVKPLEGGKSAWDLIGENTTKDFIMQYDTCNGASGGADPLQPILDHPGRGTSVHLKGYPAGTPVGEGELAWSRILEACQNVAQAEWIVMEHERYLHTTPEEAVKACLDNTKALLAASS